MRFELHHGDSREVLKSMTAASVDAIVSDPPYELGFMGKAWDASGVAYDPALWAECLRVLKPGGYMLAFSGTRTYHRMACAIEDAGFEVRDQIGWLYGSGFPKSHNGEWGGTALKPAWEPVCMARKRLIGTVRDNWQAFGTGALNIDECRVAVDPVADATQLRTMNRATRAAGDGWGMSTLQGDAPQVVRADGRWPANVLHDGSDEVLAAFPDAPGQSGLVTGDEPGRKTQNVYGAFTGERTAAVPRGDAGSAARFFYCAKASREDRNDGLFSGSTPAVGTGATMHEREAADWQSRNGNHHPTVKPTDLMRWLVRLVTPKGGLVLDPFMGSGSTGKAAMLEGLRFIGVDLTAEYVEIARARIEFAQRQGWQPSLIASA